MTTGTTGSILLVESAKIMAKGQITLPKDIRMALGVSTGDRVALVCRGSQVVMMNAATYAMNMLQEGMGVESGKAGTQSCDDATGFVKKVRSDKVGGL